MTSGPDPGWGREVPRYFGISTREIGDWRSGEIVLEGTMRTLPHLVGPAGGLRTGALLAGIDSVGGFCAGLAALPDGWVVTTNLMSRSPVLAHVGPLRLVARVLRSGRRSVVTAIDVQDAGRGDAVVADAVMTSAVLVPEGGPPTWERPVAMADLAVPGQPPVEPWLGLRHPDDHTIACALGDHLRNPWGILHGGIVGALVDLAGEHAVGRSTGAAVATADVALHFLAPGRVGPVTASAAVLAERTDGHVCRVEVRDEGAGGRTMAVAVTTVRALPA